MTDARQYPSESSADVAPSMANWRRARAMVQGLIAAGVEKWRTHDLIIGESMAHSALYERAMQEWANKPRMVPVDVPRQVDGGDPAYFRTGAGSVGARRSIAGFRESLEAAA
jgi:hypothetical protein